MTRAKVRRTFGTDLKRVIDDNYHIYQIVIPEGETIQEIVRDNYWELEGKVFSYDDVLLYATRNKMKSLKLNNKSYRLEKISLE